MLICARAATSPFSFPQIKWMMRSAGLSCFRLLRQSSLSRSNLRAASGHRLSHKRDQVSAQLSFRNASASASAPGASSASAPMGKLHRSHSKPLGAGIGSDRSRRAAGNPIPSLQTKCVPPCRPHHADGTSRAVLHARAHAPTGHFYVPRPCADHGCTCGVMLLLLLLPTLAAPTAWAEPQTAQRCIAPSARCADGSKRAPSLILGAHRPAACRRISGGQRGDWHWLLTPLASLTVTQIEAGGRMAPSPARQAAGTVPSRASASS